MLKDRCVKVSKLDTQFGQGHSTPEPEPKGRRR